MSHFYNNLNQVHFNSDLFVLVHAEKASRPWAERKSKPPQSQCSVLDTPSQVDPRRGFCPGREQSWVIHPGAVVPQL